MDKSTSQRLPKLFFSVEELSFSLALSESTIQQLVRNGDLPAPRRLSGRRVGWLVREIETWAEGRPVSELLPPPNTGAKKPRGDGVSGQKDKHHE